MTTKTMAKKSIDLYFGFIGGQYRPFRFGHSLEVDVTVRREKALDFGDRKNLKWFVLDSYLGSSAACPWVDSVALFRPARSNNPIASTANDNHQREYPIPRSDIQPSGLSRIYQCALKRKAAAATHADTRRSEGVPPNTAHGEPTMKSSVVNMLRVASIASYPVPRD
jgi:hypothetical protein